MKLHEFSADKYGDKVEEVYIMRFGLRGIWLEVPSRGIWLEDVTNLSTSIGIWPNRSGYGFGWVDLLQGIIGSEEGYRSRADGSPITRRHYGLIKVIWKKGLFKKRSFRRPYVSY